MLQPDHTVLLTDALRPPSGYRVDVAVATTYSLNLTAILVAPMTFALHDVEEASAIFEQDPVELLDAAQKYLSCTTVFCQSASIHVPSQYSRIFTFLEESIQQVTAPREGGLFHPKIWAVRYRDDEDQLHHRLLVASRNLTLDDARDTLLVLDEDPAGAVPAAPAADFVAQLPDLAIAPLSAERGSQIADLAQTLGPVHFDVPAPFTSGRLVPLGMSEVPDWPFPAAPDRVLAISPFLAAGTLHRIRGAATNDVLISRPEEIDRLGARKLSGWDVNVLDSTLELDDEDAASAIDEFVTTGGEEGGDKATFDGLHAKTVIADLVGDQSATITGSTNLTEAGWSSNVEFDALLTGPTADCGVDAALDARGESLGLMSVLQPYTPATEAGEDDPAMTTSYEVEAFHQALALTQPRLDVLGGKGRVLCRLDMEITADAPGHSEVWPITVPHRKRALEGALEWEIAPENITPFVAIRTTAGTGAARVTRSCCLLVPLVGDVPDRRQATLAAILSGPDRMLRYLAFLLGIDDGHRLRIETDALKEPDTHRIGIDEDALAPSPPIVLFEPLVRAAAQTPGHLASIAAQIEELQDLPEADGLIPAEFTQMWTVVLDVVRETRAR